MHSTLNQTLSIEIAQSIQSKPGSPFHNAYRAAISMNEVIYVQGFLALAHLHSHPLEHAWIELDGSIIDPTLPYLNRALQDIYYFPAQSLDIKALKAIIEESQEDYPEDDPLPVYGAPPYEYYGVVMLGGKTYLEAYQAAELKCREFI